MKTLHRLQRRRCQLTTPTSGHDFDQVFPLLSLFLSLLSMACADASSVGWPGAPPTSPSNKLLPSTTNSSALCQKVYLYSTHLTPQLVEFFSIKLTNIGREMCDFDFM
ncbi:unnamed protein product [Ilex paraguariensis]|uniref:Uncharacterized protein n=1 Tax=Ilex paraguariensis TaxID=185542 RepID=A0ABC8RJE6_9AQUA